LAPRPARVAGEILFCLLRPLAHCFLRCADLARGPQSEPPRA